MPSFPHHSIAPSSDFRTLPASPPHRSSTPPPPTSAPAASSTSPSPRSVASHVQQTTALDNAAPIARPQQRDKQGSVSNDDPYYTDKGSHIGGTITARHSGISLWPPSGATPSHLPRTSSLLPPARVALDSAPDSRSSSSHLYLDDSSRPTFQDPFNAQTIRALKDLEADPTRRPSRSSSVGGLSDSFRNLNRWSASSTSSGAPPGYGHRRNTSNSSRRASLGIFGFVHSSPKKLQKLRQSSVVEEEKAPTHSPRPFQTLPHIATLPSLHLDLQLSFVDTTRSSSDELQPARPDYTQEHGKQDEVSAEYWDGPAAAHDEKPLWTAHIGGRVETRLPSYYSGGPTMPYHQHSETRAHARNRSTGAKGSADSTTSSVRERERGRGGEQERVKLPSQKAMLSRALQKANTAVQLDNAQNPEAARQAYAEACELLQQVLQRTGGDEDRRKLEAIRETYTKRIGELDRLLPPYASYDEKALPRRPDSVDRGGMVFSGSDDEDALVNTATVTRIVKEETHMRWAPPAMSATARPLNTKAPPQLSIETSLHEPRAPKHPSLQSSFSRSPMRADSRNGNLVAAGSHLQPPMYDSQYLPPPLSPRRPLSPAAGPRAEVHAQTDYATANRPGPASAAAGVSGHRRDNSHESVSWLDPIEESGGSTASSVHSRSSSVGIRRKHIRAPSGETEAEFDAALDDAIEAAYNEGYEPDDGVDPLDASGIMGQYQYQEQHHQEQHQEDPDEAMASVLRRVERAREAVRASEREAMIWASEREQRLRLQQEEEDELTRQHERDSQGHGHRRLEDFYDGTNSDEEEEQFLDDMRREYAMEDFTFTASTQSQQRSGIPRESDSSGFTSRTWHSSMNSNPAESTSTTMLTTLSESTVTSAIYGKSQLQSHPPPPPPPPSQALPQLPSRPAPRPAAHDDSANSLSQGVRSRRLSANTRQLKIDTLTTGAHPPAPATAGPTQTQSKAGGYIVQQRQALSAGVNTPSFGVPRHGGPSPVPGAGPQSNVATPATPTLPQHESGDASGSPTMSRPGLPKNFSSSSLRSMQARNMSLSNTDPGMENVSPGTPLSTGFGASASASASQTRIPAIPNLPTPVSGAFKASDQTINTATGGLHLFDHDIHNTAQSAPASGSSSHVHAFVGDVPVQLEPCPTDAMLRPFWLMRCLYQTLCHPRGGYISNKLFVPRDVWRVKGVKLKSVEDKIANCDYLTAALQKLAKVDNCDADAVLEEMQALEGVLEQVQAVLTRKLGSEVGVHGANHMFKDAGAAGAAEGESSSSSSMVPRSTSVSAKGSSGFSWRRLRGKNSSAGLSSAYAGKGGSGGGAMSNNPPPTLVEGSVSTKDAIVQSVPMTSHPTSRPAKRDMSIVHFVGPNANYMNALARLFDAAQTVDQIARQVEDPGLRHADKTQVGLELCTRHAAEFFAFYICRFVLADLTMLLDKFVKRGSEWVLA